MGKPSTWDEWSYSAATNFIGIPRYLTIRSHALMVVGNHSVVTLAPASGADLDEHGSRDPSVQMQTARGMQGWSG
jgi:hypothetical protein